MLPLPKKAVDESTIQTKLQQRLCLNGWYTLRTHGNAYQAGFPDVYACSRRYGARWIEVKRPNQYRFTQAQLDVFTAFSSKNVGVWVLTDDCNGEINKLFGPSNWYTYLNTSRGIMLNTKPNRIPKSGPEAIIQDSIIAKLTSKCSCLDSNSCRIHQFQNWFCLETYGSTFQTGLPDIYCCHKIFGSRWIECKNPRGYRFTPAQTDVFPHLAAEGIAIFILVGSTDEELAKLFGPSNWFTYMWK